MLNSKNVEIINSASYFINANRNLKNFSISNPPAGFMAFPVLLCGCVNFVNLKKEHIL